MEMGRHSPRFHFVEAISRSLWQVEHTLVSGLLGKNWRWYGGQLRVVTERQHHPSKVYAVFAKNGAFIAETARVLMICQMWDESENADGKSPEGPIRISRGSSKFRIDTSESSSPAGAPFDESSASADLVFWCRMATWTIEEAVALAFGKEPEVVSWATLEPHGQTIFGEQYRLLRKLALRAVEAGRLPDPCPPLDFIEWMNQNRLVFPAELAIAVTEQLAASSAWRRQLERSKTSASSVGEDGTVNAKSFNTLLKLVGGMAVAIYKYDPSAKKSEVPKLIQSDLDLVGVSLDLDTIRKWTKAGVQTAEIL